jgi:hypothetical protein
MISEIGSSSFFPARVTMTRLEQLMASAREIDSVKIRFS